MTAKTLHIITTLLAAILLAIVVCLITASAAEADDRRFLRCPQHSGDFCSPPAPLAEQAELRQTGVWRWRYQQASGVPSIRAPIEQASQEWARQTGISVVYDPSASSNLQYAASSREFTYGNGLRVGCPGATACLNAYGRDVDIWYDAQLMATYFMRSQVGVGLHKLGHAMADAGEQYIHTGGGIFCNGDPATVMSCGIGHALTLQPFDLQTWAIFHGLPPAKFTGTGFTGGGNYIFWCETDPVATHVAILAYNTVTKGYRWTGVHAPTATDDCQGWHVDALLRPNEIPCVNIENGANKRLGRNDTCRALQIGPWLPNQNVLD